MTSGRDVVRANHKEPERPSWPQNPEDFADRSSMSEEDYIRAIMPLVPGPPSLLAMPTQGIHPKDAFRR